MRDWLYGLVAAHPGGGSRSIVDAKYEAEDLLSMYHLVSWPKELGGAGITPGYGLFTNVRSYFPLHNPRASRSLLRHLSKKLILQDKDLDLIRDLFGSKVGGLVMHRLKALTADIGSILLRLQPNIHRLSFLPGRIWTFGTGIFAAEFLVLHDSNWAMVYYFH